MVLHDINLSARYADYIFAMYQGRLEAQGAPLKIITPGLIKKIYGLDCQIIPDPVSRYTSCHSRGTSSQNHTGLKRNWRPEPIVKSNEFRPPEVSVFFSDKGRNLPGVVPLHFLNIFRKAA